MIATLASAFPQRPKHVGFFTGWNTDEATSEFVATAIGTGTVAVLDTNRNGRVRLSGAATTDNSGTEMQLDAAQIALTAGKPIYFYADNQEINESTSTNVAVESDYIFGAATLDTSLIASAPTNGIYLLKTDGSAGMALVVRKGGAAILTQELNFTWVKATGYDFRFVVTPKTGSVADIDVYAGTAGNGVTQIAAVTNVAAPFLSDGVMTLTLGFTSGDNTGTKFLDAGPIAYWTEY